VAGERPLAGSGCVIRRPDAGDEAGYATLLTDPEVSAWLRPEPEPPFSGDDIAEMVADDLRQWRDGGFGPWVVVAAGGELVGRVGLRRTSIGGELVIELAWTVRPGWQGRGLATAAALEGLELGRELGLEEVYALVLPENLSSRRVAEKLGMRAAGEVTHAGLPHLLFRIELL
jgi:[ribosomal protein S5]-alanine N-acetyltransferase